MPGPSPRLPLRVARPPGRPVLLFDGRCGFCRFCVRRGRAVTRGIDFVPWQEVGVRYPEITRAALERAMHLVEPDGRVSCAAEAVLRARALGGAGRRLLGVYERSALGARLAEALYRVAAGQRWWLSRLVGREAGAP